MDWSVRSERSLSPTGRRGCRSSSPSLKHISRNPAKLLRVLDSLLTHGVRVVTANADIRDGRIIRRDELADYHDTDMSWAGLGDVLTARPKIGRNDPCPCGSGKKYKRCCGR